MEIENEFKKEDDNANANENSNKLGSEEDLSREFRQAEEVEATKQNGESSFTDKQKKTVEDFQSKVQRISEVSEKDTEIVLELEKETKNKAQKLETKEDNKIKDLANLLIDIQLSKLESKIQFLEEYEKIIWNEKKQLEVLQKMQIAARVQLALKRNELYKSQLNHSHHQGLPNNVVNSMGGPMNNGSNMMINPHLMHKEEAKIDLHGAPNFHTNVNVDDMLNLSGIDRMDEDFGKGDQL